MSDFRVITNSHDGRILTNNNIWTADSRSILFDTRSDRLGDSFDGVRIMQLNVDTGHEDCLFLSKHGSGCGVVTAHPFDDRYIFIAGPEYPTADWMYGPSHRQGMIGHRSSSQTASNMDARDMASRPVDGALRGGTHVHMWHPKGDWIRSTYNDALVSPAIRDVAVHIPGTVDVASSHQRNISGHYHSFIVTDTETPSSNSSHITRAYEETWLGSTRQIAFMADMTVIGSTITEVFKVDVSGLSLASKHTFDTTGRIKPPTGIRQSRLTNLASGPLRIAKKPRHWLVSSPDGLQIALLLQTGSSAPQLYTLDVQTGNIVRRTNLDAGVTTAISWSNDGSLIAFGSENAVCVIDTDEWHTRRVASVSDGELLPLCCCISPDRMRIAVQVRTSSTNHVGIATLD